MTQRFPLLPEQSVTVGQQIKSFYLLMDANQDYICTCTCTCTYSIDQRHGICWHFSVVALVRTAVSTRRKRVQHEARLHLVCDPTMFGSLCERDQHQGLLRA